jgi:hypothetical protein
MARQNFGSTSACLVVFWTCALTVALPIPASTTAFVTFRGGLSAAHTAHHKHPSLCGLRRISSDVTVFACKDIAENVEGLEKRLVLLSLQWTTYHDDDGCMLPTALSDSELLHRRHQRFFSKAVANVWRWKDAILGDGRDYFLPKPQTMAALQAYLRRSDDIAARSQLPQHSQWPCQISECVVLSNCARFEILLVVLVPTDRIAQPKNSTTTDATTTWSDLASYISFKLHCQVLSHQAKPNSIWSALPGDWPAVIDPLATMNQSWSDLPVDPHPLDESVNELARHWTVMDGPRDVSRHLCLVAAGLATRPRRDDRTVVFRPFSSRDAHILCQLKRTHAIALHSNSPWLSIVLRSALQAGKAARNPKQIIALNVLRRNYGETGNSKFDMEPPVYVMKPIVDVRVASTLLGTVIRTSHFFMLSVNRQYTR